MTRYLSMIRTTRMASTTSRSARRWLRRLASMFRQLNRLMFQLHWPIQNQSGHLYRHSFTPINMFLFACFIFQLTSLITVEHHVTTTNIILNLIFPIETRMSTVRHPNIALSIMFHIET